MIAITSAVAKQKIAALQSSVSSKAALFYSGDHWQGGAGYIGPAPSSSDTGYTEAMSVIEKSFTSRNLVGEIVDRHVGGVISKTPHWKYALKRPMKPGEKPTDAETSLMNEAEALQVNWLAKRSKPVAESDDSDPLTIFTRNLLVYGRAVMRMFVPSAELVDGIVPEAGMEQSIDRIWYHALPPTTAAVLRHEETMQQYGVYIYTMQEGDPGQETAIEYMEVCQVDKASGKTIVQLYRQDVLISSASLDLGGRLTIYEARRSALVQDDVVRLQKSLNMTITIRTHNIQSAGSAERVLLNAQLPGEFKQDDNGVRRYVPADISFGAGTINNFVGVRSEAADGTVSYATPDIRYKDPVNVTTFDQSESAYTRHMYERCYQAHITITGDATASGSSRRQAMADYLTSLDTTATVIDSMLRWLLESSLRLASVFAGIPERFATLRSNAKCRLNAGAVDTEMLRTLMDLKESTFVSHELALSESGIVDDVDSELQRIQQEQQAQEQINGTANSLLERLRRNNTQLGFETINGVQGSGGNSN